MFCRTCKSYPRHFEEFENVREISLAMSCPEAAKLILMPTEPVEFITVDKKYKEEIYEKFDFLLYSKLVDAREIIFEIMQDRTWPVRMRMAFVLAFTHDLQARIYRGDVMAMEDVFTRFTKPDAKKRLEKRMKPYQNQKTDVVEIKKEMIAKFKWRLPQMLLNTNRTISVSGIAYINIIHTRSRAIGKAMSMLV